MNSKKIVLLFVFIILVSVNAFAQEPASVPSDSVTIPAAAPANSGDRGDLQWIWGSITNLDSQAKTFSVKYFDYEVDQEKDIVLSVDEKTTFENIKGFDELKIEGTVSVDYSSGVDNKNIAKNISVEKPDVVAVPAAPVAAPEVAAPEVAAQPETPAQQQ